MTPLLLLLLAPACTGGEPGAGDMGVSWEGADTAAFSAAASALWCGTPRWLEVTGERGDTGVGLVVYPTGGPESLAGDYPVSPPPRDSAADTLAAPRPGGALAVRWFDRESLEGYEAVSGVITIVDQAGKVSGSFRGVLLSVSGEDTLLVEGRFGEVLPQRGGIECQPPQADTAASGAPGTPAGSGVVD